MIFPKKSRIQEAPVAWWQPPVQKKSSKGNVILIALLAGSVGGILGVNASGGDIFNRVQLVSSTSTIERAPDSVAGIAQRVLPSVVSISTRTLNGSGTGSGFVIDSNGYILTNNHVISNAAQSGGSIQVSLNDGSFYSAKVIGRDASYDLAVLKINASGLKALQFGDSDKIAVGDSVIAIGSPLGLTGTVTTGIISAKNRAVTAGESSNESSFINALQTDAAINPGNSGGALVDTRGQLIGINTAIYSSNGGSMGIGFAIPINLAKQVMESILSNGSVTRGWIGVEPQNLSKELSESLGLPQNTTGVLLSGVLEGGPAARGGIKPGDVLVAVNGNSTKDVRQLLNQIAQIGPGNEATLKILRKDKELDLKVQTGKRPKPKTMN